MFSTITFPVNSILDTSTLPSFSHNLFNLVFVLFINQYWLDWLNLITAMVLILAQLRNMKHRKDSTSQSLWKFKPIRYLLNSLGHGARSYKMW